jgi:indolepyruvate decarboxylase
MYDGKLMNEDVRAFVEGCDLVIGIGASLTDFNSGSFTASIDRSKSVNILHHGVRVGEAVYNNVEMKDILGALTAKASRKDVRSFKTPGLGKPVGAGRQDNGRVSLRSLGRRTSSLLRPGRARWGWASPICQKDRHSIIKRFGDRSAGQRRRRLVGPWRRPTGAQS